MKILGYDINFNRTKNKVQSTPDEVKTSIAIKSKLQLFRITTDLEKYRNAVMSAENIYNPQRYRLLQLYQQTMLDPHVTACFEQRNNLIIGCDFNVYNADGTENEEKSEILEHHWYNEFLKLALSSIDYGFTLIQFEDIINTNGIDKFKEVELVLRQYVKPEFNYVCNSVASLPPDGIDFTEEPYSNWCIGVGTKHDLGLLLKLTPLVIWKKNAMGAWAEYIEKFGSPVRVGYTDSTDLESVNAMQSMLSNMGVSAWGLFKTEDKIDIIESGNTDAYMVFDQMINRCNSEISKLILMQTGTTDEKSFVGSAQVHERILNQLSEKLKKFIYTVNNDQLLPMMNRLGFGLDGCYIDIEQEDEFTLEQKGKFDIELLKTGKFTFNPAYIKEKYGTEVIEVNEPVEVNTIKKVSNSLSKYYGE